VIFCYLLCGWENTKSVNSNISNPIKELCLRRIVIVAVRRCNHNLILSSDDLYLFYLVPVASTTEIMLK